jgi:hypothetical protein
VLKNLIITRSIHDNGITKHTNNIYKHSLNYFTCLECYKSKNQI